MELFIWVANHWCQGGLVEIAAVILWEAEHTCEDFLQSVINHCYLSSPVSWLSCDFKMSSTNFICTLIVGLPSSWLKRGFVISVTGLMAGTGIIWNNLPRLNGYFCSNLPCTSFSPHYYQPSECQMSLSYLSLHSHHQVFAFQLAQAPRGWASAALIPTEYVSWSVAVFWDNSGTAIFCILFTYHMLRQHTLVLYIAGQVYHFSFLHGLFTGRSLHTPDHLNPFL